MKLWICIFFILPCLVHGELLHQEGKGALVYEEGTRILYLKGSPYDRGYQHGLLLKELIAHNIAQFIDQPALGQHPRVIDFKEKMSHMVTFIPESILEEIHGLAEGSSQPFEKVLLLNLFPEMFHCHGMTVQGSATSSGKLYHVRALDYNIGKNLQHSATLMVVEPDEGYAYLNVSYAGFIGCVTGMNTQGIAVGEIGGLGYGSWEGMPMAFLMKQVLEKASSLETAKELFVSTPRSCEYYYLVSDGRQDRAVGIYATASQIHFIEPGTSYGLLAPRGLPKNYQDHGMNDKFFIPSCKSATSDYQTTLYDQNNLLIGVVHRQPEKCIVLTGFAHPWRYPNIIQGLLEAWGNITHLTLQQLFNATTTLPSNLHNAIFLPSELKVWISHAGEQGEVAYTQKYNLFDLPSLLEKASFY